LTDVDINLSVRRIVSSIILNTEIPCADILHEINENFKGP